MHPFPSFSPHSTTQSKESLRVECIATYSKGFICSGGSGTLHLYEKTDNKNVYKKTRTVSIWVDPTTQLTQAESEISRDVLSLTINPSEEIVVCSTRTQQLYSLTLSAADLGKVGGAIRSSYGGFPTCSTVSTLCS